MTRRDFLVAAGAATLSHAQQSRTSKPNIVFIMSDDHAAHAISAYGSRINKTPNIDRLAKEGVRLANCFCTNSICTPSRAAILTGQYSHKNGVYTLNDKMDPERDNVAKRLREQGYQTAMIGKWHLQTDPSGFDYWNILPGQGLYYDPVFIEKGERKKHQGYCTDLIGDLTLKWLEQRDPGKPFFLMCHHKAPHRPWQPSPKYAKMLADEQVPEPSNLFDTYEGKPKSVAAVKMKVGDDNRETDLKTKRPEGLEGEALRKWAYQLYIKDYLRCVQSVDDNAGRVLDYLDKANLASNTVVIYTSDQGFFLGDHGFYDKRLMYEESLRMPFLMRYPGKIRPGTVNSDITTNIDFAPLLLDYAGGSPVTGTQGRSFRSNVEGRTPKDWRKAMYYRYWMHNDNDHHVPGHYGIRTDRYKLVYYYGKPLGMSGAHPPDTAPEWELYDLKSDPREMRNIYGDPSRAKLVRELKDQLAALQREYGDEPSA
jgi:arylsulfatase A-like enzyme